MKLKSIALFIFISFIWLNCSANQLLHEPKSNLSYIVKEASSPSNLLILIHGYGSNETDLFSFVNRFPQTTVICVRGPITRSANSYAWYDIAFKPDGNHGRNLNQALQSETMLLQFIEVMKEKYNTEKTIVGGFSQGAIMSAQIALSHPKAIDGIICLSGMLLSENTKANESGAEQYKSIKAFYGHGILDQVLTIDRGRRCSATIRKSGIQLTHKEYPIKHQISGQELKDIELWYKTNFLAAH
ncbi:MAG: hypothetical protein JKY53_12505 [Flavobacteriales bacterium]|nr:hypothetical protein [Flavobacteriales bacterium]